MTTYLTTKTMILAKNYNTKEEMQNRIDLFFNFKRISLEQYTELTQLLNSN